MQDFVAVPCPDCSQQITTFGLSVSLDNVITLRAKCEPCRVIAELRLSLADLKDLGAGREVALSAIRPQPDHVM